VTSQPLSDRGMAPSVPASCRRGFFQIRDGRQARPESIPPREARSHVRFAPSSSTCVADRVGVPDGGLWWPVLPAVRRGAELAAVQLA
jgi:hypothetical protein